MQVRETCLICNVPMVKAGNQGYPIYCQKHAYVFFKTTDDNQLIQRLQEFYKNDKNTAVKREEEYLDELGIINLESTSSNALPTISADPSVNDAG